MSSSVESEVHARLIGYAGLLALVAAKIRPLTMPDKTSLPYLTYQKISDVPEHAMGNDAEIRTIRMQVDVWASTFKEAKTIEAQVVACLSRVLPGC